MSGPIVLSVIVPIYNVEQYLRQCLDSLLQQASDTRIEFILVNDGSTDSSGTIAQEYIAQNREQFRLISTPNQGVSTARNLGMQQARGTYLGFVDSDDWINPKMFTIMLDAALREDADVVVCDFERVYPSGYRRVVSCGTKEEQGNPLQQKELIFLGNAASWNKIYRKKNLETNDIWFPTGVLYEDIATIPRCVAASEKVLFLAAPLYCYRIRSGSISHYWNKHKLEILDAFKLLHQNLSKDFYHEVEFYTLKILFFVTMPRFSKKHRRKEFRELLKQATTFWKNYFPTWSDNPYIKEQGFLFSLYLRFIRWKITWPMYLLYLRELYFSKKPGPHKSDDF